MGLDINGWLALTGVLIGVAAGAAQLRYWWNGGSREAAERKRLKADAAAAAAELEAAAERARRIVQTTARKDALEEWQKLYGEKDEEVAELKEQNRGQQHQLDTLRSRVDDCETKHDDCEKGRDADRQAAVAEHTRLQSEIDTLKGKVTGMANGTEKHK